jgi:pyroglutamyl-peptidase
MKLMMTGFEPFGGDAVNPSTLILNALSDDRYAGTQFVIALLPVDHHEGPATLLHALSVHKPDIVLCLGQAKGRSCLSIERLAINLLDFRIADNAGTLISDQAIVSDGPAAYFVSLPIRQMLHAVQAVGVPAELSLSAGTFLCNQVLYCALHEAAIHRPSIRAGFIHVPALPEQVVEQPGMASMSLDAMLKGVRAAMGVLVALPA